MTPSDGGVQVEVKEVQEFASVIVTDIAQRRLSRVDVIPRHPILPAGETVVFSAVAYDETGKAVAPDQVETRWRMTDPLAGIITESGVFHAGIQRGVFNNAIEVSVSHQLGGRLVTLQALASISIIQPLSELDISRVQVLSGDVQIEPQKQVALAVLALDRDGVPVPGVSFTWEMLEPNAGSVDAQGVFSSGSTTGLFPAAIRVVGQRRDDPTQSAAAVVSVLVREAGVAEPPTKVNLFPQAVSLRPGDTIEFHALALDQLGNPFPEVETSWSLRDSEAGELDSRGRFRAGQKSGTFPNLVEVTVTPRSVVGLAPLKATATVTVIEPIKSPTRLERLFLTPQVIRVKPGESIRLRATAITRRGDVSSSSLVRWTRNVDAVDVRPDGVVTARGRPGTYVDAIAAEVTQEEDGQKISLTASATVIILGALARVEVVPRQVEVAPKQVVQFTYIAYDINGTRLFDVRASWEVLDRQAGTIDGSGLFIAGKTPGEFKNVIKVTVRPTRL